MFGCDDDVDVDDGFCAEVGDGGAAYVFDAEVWNVLQSCRYFLLEGLELLWPCRIVFADFDVHLELKKGDYGKANVLRDDIWDEAKRSCCGDSRWMVCCSRARWLRNDVPCCRQICIYEG